MGLIYHGSPIPRGFRTHHFPYDKRPPKGMVHRKTHSPSLVISMLSWFELKMGRCNLPFGKRKSDRRETHEFFFFKGEKVEKVAKLCVTTRWQKTPVINGVITPISL